MPKNRIGDNPLDSLMPSEEESEKQQGGKPERPKDDEPENQNTSKTEKQTSGKTSSKKVKATYYMQEGTEQDLERAWLELRRMTGRKVSKSEIVETAIQHATRDLDEEGEGSRIANALRKE